MPKVMKPAPGWLLVARNPIKKTADEKIVISNVLTPEGKQLVGVEETKERFEKFESWGTVVRVGAPLLTESGHKLKCCARKGDQVFVRIAGAWDIDLHNPENPEEKMTVTAMPFSNVVLFGPREE